MSTPLPSANSNASLPNHKRSKRFWEPVYSPETASLAFSVFDWKLKNSHGPKESICRATDLETLAGGRAAYPIKEAAFTTCDFDGSFNFCRISFSDCTFVDCDFGRSTWSNVKFSRCTFTSCSISTSRFNDVQFIDCKWAEIGLSAEEMELTKVLISNPYEFINAAYTNTDKNVLSQKNTNAQYQLYRLEKTKAKVARMVLVAAEVAADDDAYYAAVMTHTDQLSASKAAEAMHNLKTKRGVAQLGWAPVWLMYCFERTLLRISGSINGWGGKIGRACVCGGLLILIFSGLYAAIGDFCGYWQSLLAALEVTLLVGFTKYTSVADSLPKQALVAANMLLGLWWYAVFVPTVINRISRVRQ